MPDYTEQINMASTTEELHSPVIDNDDIIIVNVEMRDFTFGAAFNKIIGVVGDKNCEIVSFKIKRIIDGHDISGCAEHKLFWRNVDTHEEGEFSLDVKISEDDEETVIFGWLSEEEVTQNPGAFEFALQILDFGADGEVVYEWNTKKGTGLTVEAGFHN